MGFEEDDDDDMENLEVIHVMSCYGCQIKARTMHLPHPAWRRLQKMYHQDLISAQKLLSRLRSLWAPVKSNDTASVACAKQDGADAQYCHNCRVSGSQTFLLLSSI